MHLDACFTTCFGLLVVYTDDIPTQLNGVHATVMHYFCLWNQFVDVGKETVERMIRSYHRCDMTLFTALHVMFHGVV